MNVKYQLTPKLEVQADVKTIKDAFQFLGACDSVLGVTTCGNCGGKHLKFQHRKPQGYDYYSLQCEDCHHELKFGQQKETGSLFAKGWEAPYRDGGESSNGAPPDREPATANVGNDDIPW